jgi:hypothetical protein
VQVAAPRPVVPEVGQGQVPLVLHQELRVELLRPWGWGWSWVGRAAGGGVREQGEEAQEKDGQEETEMRHLLLASSRNARPAGHRSPVISSYPRTRG